MGKTPLEQEHHNDNSNINSLSNNLLSRDELVQKLLNTIELTTDSRFRAGHRLKRLSKISSATTTITSLGLILIPLLSSAHHNVAFSNETINNFQIFLAVCVLVFSVSNSTAQYEVRSKDFFECADKLKVICQKFKLAMIECKSSDQPFDFEKFEVMYRNLLDGTENHEDIDYIKANRVRKDKKNKQTNLIDKAQNWILEIKYYIPTWFSYVSPVLLFALEVCFILDRLGITEVLKVIHKTN